MKAREPIISSPRAVKFQATRMRTEPKVQRTAPTSSPESETDPTAPAGKDEPTNSGTDPTAPTNGESKTPPADDGKNGENGKNGESFWMKLLTTRNILIGGALLAGGIYLWRRKQESVEGVEECSTCSMLSDAGLELPDGDHEELVKTHAEAAARFMSNASKKSSCEEKWQDLNYASVESGQALAHARSVEDPDKFEESIREAVRIYQRNKDLLEEFKKSCSKE